MVRLVRLRHKDGYVCDEVGEIVSYGWRDCGEVGETLS